MAEDAAEGRGIPRVPAVFNDRWAHDASIFYAFEALGLLDKLHRPFFDAIHRDRLRTDNWQPCPRGSRSRAWTEELREHGKSFGVQSKTKRAIRLTTGYKIDGTPAMAVHGRYTVPSSEAMLGIVNQLVGQVRKQK